jgi:serine/threonine protein kinase
LVAITKYYRLGSLAQAIYRTNPQFIISEQDWTPLLVLSFCSDIATALGVMHELGIVHNDLKVIEAVTQSMNLGKSRQISCWKKTN